MLYYKCVDCSFNAHDSFFKNRTVKPGVPRETLGFTHYGIARRTHS